MAASPSLLDGLAATIYEQIRIHGLLGSIMAKPSETLTEFARTRVAPLGFLWTLSRHAGLDVRLPEDMPFVYVKVDWPEGVPAGGWPAGEEPSPHTLLRSRLSFLDLQAQDEGTAAQRLARGALWTLHEQGYFKALQYVVEMLLSGQVHKAGVTMHVLEQLLAARRLVDSDEGILPLLIGRPPQSLEDWQNVSVRWQSGRSFRRPDLCDDFDWLRALGERHIAWCRESRNADQWLSRWARLMPLCAMLSNLFTRFELDQDLAYGTFVARVEEIQADGGGFFLTFGFGNAVRDRDRLVTPWAMAGAIAAMATYHDPDWFDQVLEERILVPDMLLDTYLEHRRHLGDVLPPHWRLASTAQRAGLADALMREPYYAVLAVSDGESLVTPEVLGDALARHGLHFEPALAADTLSIMRRSLRREAAPERPSDDEELVCDVAVPKATAGRIAAAAGVDAIGLTDWFGTIYGAVCALQAPARLTALLLGEAGPGDGATIESFVSQFPNFQHGHAERAIELDQGGDPRAAWEEIATAIAIDPSDAIFWHSAATILNRLGAEREALVAAVMSETLTPAAA